jgi:RTX calcium-binding nonapeptide repeat (4 copies)
MTQGPSQALNLGGRPDAYSDVFVTLDLMKGLGDWEYWNGQTSIITPTNLLKLDEKGWLTDLPIVDGAQTQVYANLFYGSIYPAQTFIMEWTGEGSIDISDPYTVIGPNKIRIDFKPDYGTAANPKQDGLTIILNSTDPNNTGNHIRDIKVYRAEDADLIAAGEHFNPVWFDRIDDFRVLRTHDWQSTNFPNTVNWSRNVETADQASWGLPGRGMPYELLVEVANEARSDLWINIPHTASDQYMREAAAYVKANLDPDLKVMVEFSNEYWTTIFDQYAYFVDGGAATFGNVEFAAGQFYGTRAARMADIFVAEYGVNSETLRPTLTVDNIMFNTGEAEAMLNAPASVAQGGVRPVTRDFDVIATDGYLSWWAPDQSTATMLRDWMTDADGGFGRARDFLIDQLENEVLPSWQKGRALADKYGLEFMVYEGGALLLNQVPNPDQDLTDFAIRFSQSMQMKEVYEAELAAWATVGTGAFAWYSDTGRPGPWGDYGMWKGPDFDPEPRGDAVTDASTNTPPWWVGDDRPASTFDNGKYDAGTGGNDAMVGTALADRFYGLAGNDRLSGSTGADRLWGGIGNDTLQGGSGADELNGGDGRDIADYSASTGAVVVNLYSGKGFGGDARGDTLSQIESLRGGSGGDKLTGNAESNSLLGGGGKDTLSGGAGADRLTGGAQNDCFVFGAPKLGADTVTDFSNVAGNDDIFHLQRSGFGNHATGAMTAAEFQSSNAASAGTAATRFVYDRDDYKLYFDADGTGTQAAVLIATLQQGAVVTVSDFLFF